MPAVSSRPHDPNPGPWRFVKFGKRRAEVATSSSRMEDAMTPKTPV